MKTRSTPLPSALELGRVKGGGHGHLPESFRPTRQWAGVSLIGATTELRCPAVGGRCCQRDDTEGGIGQQCPRCPAAHRAAEQEALAERGAGMPREVLELVDPLDALDDDVESERLAHDDHRPDQRARALVVVHVGHERAIDLEDADRQPLQVVHRREADAEVVDREAHVGIGQRAHRGQAARVVVDEVAFGHLEDQVDVAHPVARARGRRRRTTRAAAAGPRR